MRKALENDYKEIHAVFSRGNELYYLIANFISGTVIAERIYADISFARETFFLGDWIAIPGNLAYRAYTVGYHDGTMISSI